MLWEKQGKVLVAGHDMNWAVVAKFRGMLVQGGNGSWWYYWCNMMLGLQMMDYWRRQDKTIFAGNKMNSEVE